MRTFDILVDMGVKRVKMCLEMSWCSTIKNKESIGEWCVPNELTMQQRSKLPGNEGNSILFLYKMCQFFAFLHSFGAVFLKISVEWDCITTDNIKYPKLVVFIA